MCPPALYCCVRLCLAILYICLPALDVASSSFDFEKHKLFGVYGGVIFFFRVYFPNLPNPDQLEGPIMIGRLPCLELHTHELIHVSFCIPIWIRLAARGPATSATAASRSKKAEEAGCVRPCAGCVSPLKEDSDGQNAMEKNMVMKDVPGPSRGGAWTSLNSKGAMNRHPLEGPGTNSY